MGDERFMFYCRETGVQEFKYPIYVYNNLIIYTGSRNGGLFNKKRDVGTSGSSSLMFRQEFISRPNTVIVHVFYGDPVYFYYQNVSPSLRSLDTS